RAAGLAPPIPPIELRFVPVLPQHEVVRPPVLLTTQVCQAWCLPLICKFIIPFRMVGVTGLEPATSRPPAVRASQLRHTPMVFYPGYYTLPLGSYLKQLKSPSWG